MKIGVRFVPGDVWVGVYVAPRRVGIDNRGIVYLRCVYICILPMFPIRVAWEWRGDEWEDETDREQPWLG